MEETQKLAQFSVPGGSNGPQSLAAPSGVPEGLRGGLETSGTAFFQTVVNNLIIVGSFLALVMVIISGTQYIMSRGEPEKLASAKRRFLFAIVGLVVMLGAFFIVRVIVFITGGDFNQFANPASMLSE
jgi:type IV secretory pathway VirB2 component (pilin)